MTASLSIALLKTELPIPAGETMAALKVQSDGYVQEFPLQNAAPVNPPGVLWRLFRNWL